MKLKSILIGLVSVLTTLSAFAVEQFTLIGNSPLDIRNLGLMQNNFGADEKLTGHRLIKACESIDNSMVVIFADQLPADTLEEWFSKPGICNSLKELLRRGGVLYFGWNSWTNLMHPLTATRAFYKSCDLPLPSGVNLAEFPDPVVREKPQDCYANSACDASFLREINDYTASNGQGDYQMTSTYWFKGFKHPRLETFFATRENHPVIVGVRNVLGKGVAIYSCSFTPMRQKESFFITNLINFAYGKREKLSSQELAAQSVAQLTGGSANQKKVDLPPFLMLPASREEAVKLTFTLLNTKDAPKFASEAFVYGNAEKITVAFRCYFPNADAVVNKASVRDDSVWRDDAVCIMFAADKNEAPNHSFILNSDGAVYDSRGNNALWNGNFTLTVNRYADYWEGEFSIAPSELGVDLAQDGYLMFNIGREGTPIGVKADTGVEATEVSAVYPGYNNPAGYAMLGLGDEKALVEKYVARRQPPKVDVPYLVWVDNPYRKKFTTSLPEEVVEQCELHVTVARNEKECAAFLITNFSDKTMTFRLEPDFQLKNTNIPFSDLLTLKEALPRLNQLGEPQFDALSKLNEAGVITIPSYETKLLWIDVKTMLPAGTYQWSVEMVPTLTRDERKKLTLTVEVLDYTFPEELRADVWGFGPYIFSFATGKRQEYYDMWREYHHDYICHWLGIQPKAISYDAATDTIIISENPDDYRMDEEYLLEQGFKWFYSYGSYWPFVEELAKYGKKLSIKDPEFRELFGKYLKNWAASLRSRNIPFDRFYVEVQDEPLPEVYDLYVEAGLFIKECVPEFQMFGTMPTWIDQPFLDRCQQFIDLWLPYEPRLTERAGRAEELAFFKASGGKFIPYLCSIGLPQINMQTYCRFRGIRSFLMGNDGFAQWGFNSWQGNEWFPSNHTGAENGFMFYHGNDGAIVCPRMEAFREAAEDLHMLLVAQEILQNKQDAELAQLLSEKTLNEILSADDPDLTSKWRTALLKRLAVLDK